MTAAAGGATTGFANLLAPYFALLAPRWHPDPAARWSMISSSPARRWSAPASPIPRRCWRASCRGGSDEAARLFRQSVNLTRDIERSRVEDRPARRRCPRPTPDEQMRATRAAGALAALEADQVATQAQLGRISALPRDLAPQAMTLADLRKALRPGEAYFKLAVIGDAVYAIFVTPDDATAYRTGIGATALERKVDALRDTISIVENGQPRHLSVRREAGARALCRADAADRRASCRR